MTRERSKLIQPRDQAWGALVAMCVSVGAAASQSILQLSSDELRAAADHGLALVSESQSDLTRLATALDTARLERRVFFARTAIASMADAFDQEARRARLNAPANAKRRRKNIRWSSAASAYVASLDALLERLDGGARVEVFAERTGAVHVVVDRTRIVVAGPRIDNPDPLEERIVKGYCRVFPCDLARPPPPRDAVPAYPDGSFTGWDFRDRHSPTFETAEGIHFIFADFRNRRQREAACLSVVRELRGIAAALRHVADLDHRIDWGLISVNREPGSVWHRLVINRRGDYLRLELPVLGKSLAIWSSSLPWLRAQVEGRAYRQYLPRAELLLARLLAR